MEAKVIESYRIRLDMAGDIAVAQRVLSQECYRKGLCVTIEPQRFIYTGGVEDGFRVGFINYPRFPATPEELWDRAIHIAGELLRECCQTSYLLDDGKRMRWVSVYDEVTGRKRE